MSESDEEDVSIVVSLERILEDLRDAEARVTKLIATERRARREDESVAKTLRKIRRELSAVHVELEEVAAQQVAVVVQKAPAKKKRERAVVNDERNKDPEGVSVDEGAVKKPKKRGAPGARPVAVASAKLIGDGMAGRMGDHLVYFGLLQERNKQLWVCEARNSSNGIVKTMTANRKKLQQVEFASLDAEEQAWYLTQLELDIVKRFRINFPVLFSRSGYDMIDARNSLLRDPAMCSSVIDSLANHVEVTQLFSKTSPALSTANNTALMVASILHGELSASGDPKWYEEFEGKVKSMCKRCNLTFSTTIRYQKVGALMLRSNVLACLLPSFIALLEAPVTALLDNKESLLRLEKVFDEHMSVLRVDNIGQVEVSMMKGSEGLPFHDQKLTPSSVPSCCCPSFGICNPSTTQGGVCICCTKNSEIPEMPKVSDDVNACEECAECLCLLQRSLVL